MFSRLATAGLPVILGLPVISLPAPERRCFGAEAVRFECFFERDPAPGYRSYANGSLGAIGDYGCGWSSSVPTNSAEAYNLGFYSGWFSSQSNNPRAYGLQVRCLQE